MYYLTKTEGLHTYSIKYSGSDYFLPRNISELSITFNTPPTFLSADMTFPNNASVLYVGMIII